MSLWIIADDFGIDVERDRGIMHCFHQGAITAVSLMVNGPSAIKAAKLAIRYNVPIGLHLNLTEFEPIAKPSLSSMLLCPVTVDDNTQKQRHCMRGKIGIRKWLKDITDNHDSALMSAAVSAIRNEILAQLKRFSILMSGAVPRHVDGHQHVHVLDVVAPILAEEMARAGIMMTRIPDEPLTTDINDFLASVINNARDARHVFSSYGIKASDCFVGLTLMGSACSEAAFFSTIESTLKRSRFVEAGSHASIEWMCHPGFIGNINVDAFNASPDREHELQVLCLLADKKRWPTTLASALQVHKDTTNHF